MCLYDKRTKKNTSANNKLKYIDYILVLRST